METELTLEDDHSGKQAEIQLDGDEAWVLATQNATKAFKIMDYLEAKQPSPKFH